MGRREEMIEKATKIFKERGYRATTVEDVSRELNLTKGSFYYYLNSKEELLSEIYDRAGSKFYSTLLPVVQGNLPIEQKLQAVLEAHVQLISEEQELFSVYFKEKMELPPEKQDIIMVKMRNYTSLLEDLVREAMQEGIIADSDPKIVTQGILGMCNWVHVWFKDTGPLRGEEIGRILFQLIARRANGKED